jgi:ribosome biogenesis GTPase
MSKGLVIKSTGSWYQVLDGNGVVHSCRVRGKVRTHGIRTTNPIAVGDQVSIESDSTGEMVITDIDDRKNYVIRKSVNLSKEAQIVAANIDIALLVVTLKQPDTSTGFIDRFIATAEAYHIETILVLHKCDIYSDEEMETVDELIDLYESIGYRTVKVSSVTGQGLDELRELIKGKVSMLGGHSGTGKSTLINKLVPGMELRTGEISSYHQKGMHTTTFAEMFRLPEGGFIIDTPGIKGFGLVDIPKEEVHHHFVEFFRLLPDCKFHNCLHINEPGCAVIRGLEEGTVAPSRYRSYLSICEDDGGIYR